MKKVAILTISTGKYNQLFNDFKNSVFDKFLPEYEKRIFVFTDEKYTENTNVKSIKILHLPWPLNTLLRFNYFNTIQNELKEYDFIYYIDCDIIVHDYINEEIIPTENQIVAAKHYWFENQVGTYETENKNSNACVDKSTLSVGNYCQACFFGAKSQDFIKMNSILDNNVREDLKKNIIAIWHDESHFNKYILNTPCIRLHTGYTHPSIYDIIENRNPVKLLHKNANKLGM